MLLRRQIVAKKYAQAFINLHKNKITPHSLSHLQALENFCRTNKKFFIFLSISSIPYQSKKRALDRMAKALKLEPLTQQLLIVLLQKKRIHLLNLIIHEVIELYKTHMHIETFNIATSHALNENQKKKIIAFIQNATKPQTNVKTHFSIDRKLISGIRIKSVTSYWEYSIAQRLAALKKNLYQRVGL